MGDAAMIKARLSQYGALWLGGFVLTLAATAGATLGLGGDLIEVADTLLPLAFLALGAAVLFGVVVSVLAPVGLVAKSLVTALALLLILPLLWSPVLAVLVMAKIEQTPIEYSEAYAQFRIIVSQLIYPVVAMLVEGPLVAAVWNAFQMVASIVGFVASALQVWKFLKPWMRREAAEA